MNDMSSALAEAHYTWQQERLDALRAADGWLSVIDLVWLDDGMHSVGSGAECAVRIDGLPAHFGSIEIAEGRATWRADGAEPQALDSDRAGAATVIGHGGISFFLIERDQGLGLRVRDANAPRRSAFAGIPAWPFSPAWRKTATWDGVFAVFFIEGKQCRLRPQDPGAARLHFVFADATSGRETYGGGRFLYAERSAADADGGIVLDFNRAINPPCAFTPFAVCPLPPAENRLPVPVRAGEQTYR